MLNFDYSVTNYSALDGTHVGWLGGLGSMGQALDLVKLTRLFSILRSLYNIIGTWRRKEHVDVKIAVLEDLGPSIYISSLC